MYITFPKCLILEMQMRIKIYIRHHIIDRNIYCTLLRNIHKCLPNWQQGDFERGREGGPDTCDRNIPHICDLIFLHIWHVCDGACLHMYNLCCFVVESVLSQFLHFCVEKINQKVAYLETNYKYKEIPNCS